MASTPRRALKKVFGINVRLERTRQEITQEELAARAKINQKNISEIERGVTAASLETIEKIARALKVPAAQLLDEALGRSGSD